MSKFVKYEMRATARYLLPAYAVLLLSGLFLTFTNGRPGAFSGFTWLFSLVFILSLLAVGILCLFILVSRFYSNVMTDKAYLTMTLPMTVHEYLWAELIVSVIWVLISAVIIVTMGTVCISTARLFTFSGFSNGAGDVFGALRMAIARGEIGTGFVIAFAAECVIAVPALLICWCLRFYLSMSCGQMAANHKILLSVIAYIALGVILSGITTRGTAAIAGLNCRYFYQCVVLAGAYIDVVALGVAAVMYFFTALILKKKLNLQ